MSDVNKSMYKDTLDEIQTIIHKDLLKDMGFKKSGRTFNRITEDGLTQVVNFQLGQYPIGNYVIPGIRENLYGYFTINMGVFIPEIAELEGSPFLKKVFQEYDCHIRTRLCELYSDKDIWWDLSMGSETISTEIIKLMNNYATKFFNDFSTREKVIENLIDYIDKYHIMSRKYLDIGLINYKMGDKDLATKNINKHYNGTDVKGHKQYVLNLANKLGILISEERKV